MKTIHYAIPILLLIGLSTVMIFVQSTTWSLGLAIGIVALCGLYFMKDVIDWKYYLKNPPELEAPVLRILSNIRFYNLLNGGDQHKFRTRLSLFMLAHEYLIQPTKKQPDSEAKEAPEDIKSIVSIPAIILCFDKEEYLIPEVERIYLYNHPFPSPAHSELHHSESDKTDKVIILSFPHVEKGVLQPHIYFDIAMYEWCRVTGFISKKGMDWQDFEQTYSIEQSQMEKAIGLKMIDLPAVCEVLETHKKYSLINS